QRLRAVLGAEADARLRQRGQRNLDAVAIHQLERELRRPVRIPADRWTAPGLVHGLAVERRNVREVDVDAAWCWHCKLNSGCRARESGHPVNTEISCGARRYHACSFAGYWIARVRGR